MKIAILTALDFAKPGGAERLLIDMATSLNADIVTPYISKESEVRLRKAGVSTIISYGSKLPGEPLRQIAGMLFFRRLSLPHDFFIPTDDMSVRYLAKNVPHLYYMLTPRRAMYDMYYPFLRSKHGLSRYAYFFALNSMRILDLSFVHRHVDTIACISHNVRNRIYKVYGKDSHVIYPPVHAASYQIKPSENFWLSVGRVDKWKRISLQVEAFREMPDERLFIAGPIYPAYKEIVRNAPDNVNFLGPLGEDSLVSLYSRCTGVITTSVDEDYGLTPVEAMASGKPVIATKEGGHLETVLDGITGILISPTKEELKNAVKKISIAPELYREACISRATLFDFALIAQEMNDLVRLIMSKYHDKHED